jgi:hypothetical protein
MNKLETELQRLYFLPGQDWPNLASEAGNRTIDLISPTGAARCLVLSVARGCDWDQIAALYEGVQADFNLPAPAIAVSVEAGFQIWFSLAEPVSLPLAREFVDALCAKYLAETNAAKLTLRPDVTTELRCIHLVPAKQANADRWSAFIDPTMGSMFVAETWLEMAPNLDKQAGMLAGLESIKAGDFQRVLATLQSQANTDPSLPHPSSLRVEDDPLQPPGKTSTLSIGGGFTDPTSFLLAVMNEPSASADQRIAAASALLPFFAKTAEK